MHRIGRTGRAGRSGDAISFVTPRERRLLTAIERATRQPLTQMQLPTVEDVNVTRLARFDDAITAALEQDDRIARFRDIIGHYVEHHDVPEADVAAALAVVAQGDEPLLLSPEDDRRAARSSATTASGRAPSAATAAAAATAGRRAATVRERERAERQPMAPYRIEVGKRQKVEPRQIVGALANEGGLSREDFGAHRHPARLLARRAARRPARVTSSTGSRHAHQRQAHRAAARPRRPAAARRAGPAARCSPPSAAPSRW